MDLHNGNMEFHNYGNLSLRGFVACGIPSAGILFRCETIHLFEELLQMHPHLPGYVVF